MGVQSYPPSLALLSGIEITENNAIDDFCVATSCKVYLFIDNEGMKNDANWFSEIKAV